MFHTVGLVLKSFKSILFEHKISHNMSNERLISKYLQKHKCEKRAKLNVNYCTVVFADKRIWVYEDRVLRSLFLKFKL